MGKPPKLLHIVRFGTAADQSELAKFNQTYDLLALNANMVAHMPSALSKFISQKITNKPYFIDPQTHAFQHGLSFLESSAEGKEGEIKSSIAKLIRLYGNPFEKRILKDKDRGPVEPEDFKRNLPDFCQRVRDFQNNTLSKVAQSSDTQKYYTFLKAKGKNVSIESKPKFFIAPYFFLAPGTYGDWLRVNTRCAKECIDNKRTDKVAIEIVLSKSILFDESARNEIIEAYCKIPQPDWFLIWVDEFNEQSASQKELECFLSFIQKLGDRAPVINLYGGFFSVVAARLEIVKALRGVTHGLEYGESRGVIPVGGGIPSAKFYIPSLHSRLPFRDAYRVVKDLGGFDSLNKYYENVCNCEECKSLIQNNPEADFGVYGKSKPKTFFRNGQPVTREYPLVETKQKCLRHYMWNKSEEYTNPKFADKIALFKSLDETQKAISSLSREELAHCFIWKKVLGPD